MATAQRLHQHVMLVNGSGVPFLRNLRHDPVIGSRSVVARSDQVHPRENAQVMRVEHERAPFQGAGVQHLCGDLAPEPGERLEPGDGGNGLQRREMPQIDRAAARREGAQHLVDSLCRLVGKTHPLELARQAIEGQGGECVPRSEPIEKGVGNRARLLGRHARADQPLDHRPFGGFARRGRALHRAEALNEIVVQPAQDGGDRAGRRGCAHSHSIVPGGLLV